MVTRVLPTSGVITGNAWRDEIQNRLTPLFDNMSLIPQTITNSGNDYTITMDPALNSDFGSGMSFWIKPNNTNTGPVRIRANAGPYYAVTKADSSALGAGDFDATITYLCVFAAGGMLLFTSISTGANILVVDIQVFTTSGTWVKFANISDTAITRIYGWGGGGGARNAPGGGAGYNEITVITSELSSVESVTVGAGGSGGGVDGGNSTFGSFMTAYGGGGGGNSSTGNNPGSGGGELEAGQTVNGDGLGGAIGGGDAFSTGGSGGGDATTMYGGGGASNNTGFDGGRAVFGGGGGADTGVGFGGISLYGGNGGDPATAGEAPGGGAGAEISQHHAGGRGEIVAITIG